MMKFYLASFFVSCTLIFGYFLFISRNILKKRVEVGRMLAISIRQFYISFIFCLIIVSIQSIVSVAFSKFWFIQAENLKMELFLIAFFHTLMVAVTEEIITRGIVFSFLLWGMSKFLHSIRVSVKALVAIILQALIFNFLHDLRFDISSFGVATFCMGIFLGILTWRTKTLWMAIGFHFAWNFSHKLIVGIHDDYFPRLPGVLTIEANNALIDAYILAFIAIISLAFFRKTRGQQAPDG